MAMMPPHRCPSCGSLITGRCLVCDRQRDVRRGTSCARGYNSARWRRLRAWHLEQHPACVMCWGADRVMCATDVDHVIPVTGPDDPKFWDTANLQSLCRRCHSRKTAVEDSTFARRKA